MLEAIRLIVQGHTLPPPAAAHAALNEFCGQAHQRWLRLIKALPPEDPGRMPQGYYRLCLEMIGVEPARNFPELKARMNEAGRIKHTGWGPFVSLTRQDLAPNVVDQAIEVWLGEPEAERAARTPEHCDFWRASRDGLFFLQRGYDEDSSERVEPGTFIDITLPIWRVGEALLYSSRLSRLFGEDPEIFIRLHYTGLRDRELGYFTGFGVRREERTSTDNELMLETQALATQLNDNLAEVVHTLLSPLYERFDFFELSFELVARELERMRRNRF